MTEQAKKKNEINFFCTECQNRIRVSVKMAGRRGKCPTCHSAVTVPDHSDVVEVDEEKIEAVIASKVDETQTTEPDDSSSDAAPGKDERLPRPSILSAMSGRLILMVAVLVFGLGYLMIFGTQGSLARRYATANLRQGYVLGFGLGTHLKQTQSNRRLVFLKTTPENPRDAETIDGLLDGLDGALEVVGELEVELPNSPSAQAALFTTDRLAEMRATGAEIVVSFVGLPVKLDENGRGSMDATRELWSSPEYGELQWVLPTPLEDLPPGSFEEGRVLAAVWEKVHTVAKNEFPAHLELEGTLTELFEAWFELVTAEVEE